MREVLLRPAYRGEAVYGKTAKAYGRELGPQRGAREKGQIPVPEETWIRHEVLAIVNPEHAWMPVVRHGSNGRHPADVHNSARQVSANRWLVEVSDVRRILRGTCGSPR